MDLNFTGSCFAISMIFVLYFCIQLLNTRHTTDVIIDRYNINDELSHQWPSSSRPNIFLYSFMILYQSSTVDIYNVSTALDIFPVVVMISHCIPILMLCITVVPAFLKFHKRCGVVYSLKIGKKDTLILTYLCMLFVIQVGDCHPNPGPPRFSCYICEKACWWGQKAVACDQCNQWYHIRCIGMHTFSYNNIDSKESWYWCQCGIPNFASSLFNSEIRLSDFSSNSTTSTRIGSVDSDDSFESPLLTQ